MAITYQDTSVTGTGSEPPRYYRTITFADAAAGDLLVAGGVSMDLVSAIENTPAVATTSGSTSSWTSSYSASSGSDCDWVMGWAEVSSTGSVTVRVNVRSSTDGAGHMYVAGWLIPDGEWSGTPALTAMAGGDADGRVTVSVGSSGSNVFYLAGDWDAGTVSGSEPSTNATDHESTQDSGYYTVAARSWSSQDSGSRSYGVGTESGGDWTGAVMVVAGASGTGATVPATAVAGTSTVQTYSTRGAEIVMGGASKQGIWT